MRKRLQLAQVAVGGGEEVVRIDDAVKSNMLVAVGDRIRGVLEVVREDAAVRRLRNELIAQRRQIVLEVDAQTIARLDPQTLLAVLALQVGHQVELDTVAHARVASDFDRNKTGHATVHYKLRSQQWIRLFSAPDVVWDKTQPIRSSRDVSLRTTTKLRHSLQRYQHASTRPFMCKYNQYEAAGMLACARRRNDATRCNGINMFPFGPLCANITSSGDT